MNKENKRKTRIILSVFFIISFVIALALSIYVFVGFQSFLADDVDEISTSMNELAKKINETEFSDEIQYIKYRTDFNLLVIVEMYIVIITYVVVTVSTIMLLFSMTLFWSDLKGKKTIKQRIQELEERVGL